MEYRTLTVGTSYEIKFYKFVYIPTICLLGKPICQIVTHIIKIQFEEANSTTFNPTSYLWF